SRDENGWTWRRLRDDYPCECAEWTMDRGYSPESTRQSHPHALLAERGGRRPVVEGVLARPDLLLFGQFLNRGPMVPMGSSWRSRRPHHPESDAWFTSRAGADRR